MKATVIGVLALSCALVGCNKGSKDDDKSSKEESAEASDEEGDDGEVSKLEDVSECKSYIAKVEECGDSTLDSRRSAVEKQLSRSKNRSAVRKFCSSMGDRYTCRHKSGDKRDDKSASAKEEKDDAPGGEMGIKACDDYLAKLRECGEDDSFVNMSRKGFQIKLDEGKSEESIAKGCATLARVYKCKK